MQEIKMNGESLNIEQENIAKLKEIFPEVFNEDKIDFEKLQNVLGNYIDTDEEKYRFTWNGKMDALRLSQTPSTGTLRPCKEESRDWDTTQNLYIEGDNLEVLKLLQNSYLNKIKMIYIDPPYNTGNDFVYKDDFKDNITNYKKMTGQIDSDGNSTSTNKETDGRYHTNWLNMMYPRLRLARNLLTDDGVIFISIGDDEISNLKKICDEIFDENNLCGIISRLMKSGGANGKFFSPNIEYILVYSKNVNLVNDFKEPISDEIINKLYTSIEDSGNRKGEKYRPFGLYQSSLDPLRGCANQRYFIETPDGSLVIPPGENMPEIKKDGELIPPKSSQDKVWRWSRDRYLEEKANGNIVFKKSKGVLIDENGQPSKWNVYSKIWLSDRENEGMVPVNLITKWENRQSKKELQELNIPFDFAKPVDLIKYLISISGCADNSIILDFFSGSATTAHSTMQLNMENMTNLKFIMVQFPELTYEGKKEKYVDSSGKEQERYIIDKETGYPLVAKDSEARKRGFYTISAIGKERVKKAGNKIKEEIENCNQQLKLGEEPKKLPDIGFKVFKLDSSNIRKWNPDTKDLERTLLDQVDNFVEGRKEEDALYEIILKNGLPLTVPVEELNVKGKKVYSIGMGAMIVCLDNNITLDVADEIAQISTEFEDKSMVTVVFKDNGFENDSVKTNIKETLRGYGIGKFVTV